MSGGEDNTLTVFDYRSARGSKTAVARVQGHSAACLSVAVNMGGALVASADASGALLLWKLITM